MIKGNSQLGNCVDSRTIKYFDVEDGSNIIAAFEDAKSKGFFKNIKSLEQIESNLTLEKIKRDLGEDRFERLQQMINDPIIDPEGYI